jgi:DNA-binding NtrC family response regulator
MTGKSLSIIVVDDDEATCENISDILEDRGFNVDVAHEGHSALDMIGRKTYDLALLDLKMPGMDGLELYRKMRELNAGTVAIIVTAFATPETAEEALQAGAWQVMSKPADFTKLLTFVNEVGNQPLVMVVDDDTDLCHNLWDTLRDRQFRVCIANDQKSAADKLKERDYRVVLIDLKLPDGDGQKVLNEVRQMNPEARTVLITGYRDEMEQTIQGAMDEGADAVCYKPFDVPRLLETIESLADRQD